MYVHFAHRKRFIVLHGGPPSIEVTCNGHFENILLHSIIMANTSQNITRCTELPFSVNVSICPLSQAMVNCSE